MRSRTVSFVADVGLEGALLTNEHPGNTTMGETLRTGTILIEDGVIFPVSLRIESGPYAPGWRIVKDLDGYGLDRAMREAGWTCFYMANEIDMGALALNEQKSLGRAVGKILTKLKLERFNSLEITRVVTKRILGLPHTTVSAHARHIQESMFLFDWLKKRPSPHVTVPSAPTTASLDA